MIPSMTVARTGPPLVFDTGAKLMKAGNHNIVLMVMMVMLTMMFILEQVWQEMRSHLW